MGRKLGGPLQRSTYGLRDLWKCDSSLIEPLCVMTSENRGCTMALVPSGGHGNANMALVPSTFHREYSVDTKKTGDVEKERQVEDRMRQLGLYEGKQRMERGLRDRLASAIDQDAVMGAVSKYKRRERPLAASVGSIVSSINDVIRHRVTRDRDGRKVSYQVSILMGQFTKDVTHRVIDHNQVMVTGITQSGTKLTKEVTVEFPDDVEISKLLVSYSAGVFKMEVPFTPRSCSQRALWNSVYSDESMSVTSDTDSEVFPNSPTPEPD